MTALLPQPRPWLFPAPNKIKNRVFNCKFNKPEVDHDFQAALNCASLRLQETLRPGILSLSLSLFRVCNFLWGISSNGCASIAGARISCKLCCWGIFGVKMTIWKLQIFMSISWKLKKNSHLNTKRKCWFTNLQPPTVKASMVALHFLFYASRLKFWWIETCNLMQWVGFSDSICYKFLSK